MEEITARAGRRAQTEEHNDVWIKRDMNLEERQKEKDLRLEAKDKEIKEDRDREKDFLLEGVRHEAEEVVYAGERR